MRDLLTLRQVRIWMTLLVLTAVSLVIGHESWGLARHGMVFCIVSLAFLKVRLVMLSFMELSTAPRPLRLAAEVWCFGAAGVLIVVLNR